MLVHRRELVWELQITESNKVSVFLNVPSVLTLVLTQFKNCILLSVNISENYVSFSEKRENFGKSEARVQGRQVCVVLFFCHLP